MRKWLALLGGVVLALALVVGVKTLTMPSRQVAATPVKPVAVDAAAASERLGAAVRLKTIASPTDVDANAGEFLALQAHLQASFPKAHAVLRREVIGKYGLLYTWAGSDAQAAPIALMAHQDVVPVAPGTEGDWQVAPFSGTQKDGFVWGRGAWDDKGNLMSIMEAVEMRVAAGFQPRQTIYLVFGQDEELGGERGARQIAALLKERGIRLRFVLDEGMLITEGAIAGPRQAGGAGRRRREGLPHRRARGDGDAGPFVDAAGRRRHVGDRHAERGAGAAREGADAARDPRRRARDLREPRARDERPEPGAAVEPLALSPARRIAAEDHGRAPTRRCARRPRSPSSTPARPRTCCPGARRRSSTSACCRATRATRSSTTSCGPSPTRRSSVERLTPFTEASRVAATDAPGYRAIARTLRRAASRRRRRAGADDRRDRLAPLRRRRRQRLQVLAGARHAPRT